MKERQGRFIPSPICVTVEGASLGLLAIKNIVRNTKQLYYTVYNSFSVSSCLLWVFCVSLCIFSGSIVGLGHHLTALTSAAFVGL